MGLALVTFYWVPTTWTYVLTRQRRPGGITIRTVTMSSGLGTDIMFKHLYKV